MEPTGRRRDLLAAAGLVLILTVLFADILFLGNALYFRDLTREYYPTRRIFHDIVRGGELPLWNPRYGAGQPFAANPGYQAFYPVAWLTLLLPDFDLGFRLEVLVHYYLAALAMFAFIRSLGAGRPAAVLGGLSWAVGGVLASLSNLLPFLFSAAWLPLFALYLRRFLGTRRTRDFALASLVFGVILLAGDQSMILQSGLLAGTYAIYRTLRSRTSVARAVGAIALVSIAALAVGAAQIAPALDFQRDSGRAVPLSEHEVMDWSMAPVRPLELLLPDVFGRFTADAPVFWGRRLTGHFSTPFILSMYQGLLIGALIMAGFAGKTRGWSFAAVFGAISYAIALGRFGPVFPLLYAAGMRSLRYPEKFWISGLFVLTAFAALAFDERERIAGKLRAAVFAVAALTITLTAVALTPAYGRIFDALWHLPGAEALRDQSRTAWLIMAGIALLWALVFAVRRRLPERTWLALCGVVLLIDIAPRTTGLMPRVSPEYTTPPPIVGQLERPPQEARIINQADWQFLLAGAPGVPYTAGPWVVRNSLAPRSFATWGIKGVIDLDITGTDLLPTRDFTGTMWALSKQRPDRLPLFQRMTGASHMIRPLPLREWRGSRVEDVEPVQLTQLPDGTREYFADAVVPIRGGLDFALRMVSPAAFPLRTAFVETTAAVSAGRGRLLRKVERANEMSFDVEADRDACLVIAVTPHRYWSATVDGSPATLLRTNIGFQSVAVPAGRHQVRMIYRNPVVTVSLAVSIIALAALIIAALRDRQSATQTA